MQLRRADNEWIVDSIIIFLRHNIPKMACWQPSVLMTYTVDCQFKIVLAVPAAATCQHFVPISGTIGIVQPYWLREL